MKGLLLLVASFTTSIALVSSASAQNPTYILNATNRTATPSIVNSVEWDIDMTWTNSGVAPNFEYAGGQYFFDVNLAIANGGTLSMSNAGSDLPTNMQPRNPTVFTGSTPGQLRWAVNTFPGAGSGFNMPAGVPITIVRVRLQTTAAQFAATSMNLAWRNALPNPFTKIFAYVGTTNTDISTPGNHVISFSNDPFFNGLEANFYASTRSVTYGQYVNFFDSTLGAPTSWEWLFTGGTPSTSTAQNPTNIRYNTPGTYPVRLIARKTGFVDTVLKSNYITVNPFPCGTTWVQMIRLSDAGNVNDSLFFGLSPQGSDGLDTCLGEQALPPPPPAGAFDCRFQLLSPNDSKRDIKKDTIGNQVWFMKFQPSFAGYPITFTWNASALPSTGFFYLKDAINGSIVNINMREQSSYVLTNSGITSLKIEYLYKTTVNVSVNPFWNMVSVPVLAENMHVTSLFPGCYLPAYGYNNGYVTVTNFVNGKGYWVQFENAGIYGISGIRPTPYEISVLQGWNMIGPFEEKIPVNRIVTNPPGIISTPFYGFNYGYVLADTLKPGKGYWVRTTSAGTMRKDTTVLMAYGGMQHDNMNSWTRLEISDEGGNKTALYLARPEEVTSDFMLPPPPPTGVYDVRFSSDALAEALGQNHEISIGSSTGALKVKAFNIGENKLRITDAVNGIILNRELKEGEEIVINERLEKLILLEENLLPDTYELSQNYPNPFNPATTIKYQLPNSGNVKIVMYDVIGRELMTLVDKQQSAGYYEVRFDASSLASGVYFYRMTSGSFTDLKKMILLK